MLLELRYGTRVKITGGKAEAIGWIEHNWPLDEIEFVDSFESKCAATMEMLRSLGVKRVALISFRITQHTEAVFTALEIGGAWFDLQRNPISLEVVGQYAGH